MISYTKFPVLAMRNKEAIKMSNEVGCYHCIKIFESQEIKEWTDNDQTAICPFCKVDALIPNMPDYKLTEDILKQANSFWM